MKPFNKMMHPEILQGNLEQKNYFEGWYYKLLNKSGTHGMALIPGFAAGEGKSERHAFVQVICDEVEGAAKSSWYVRYDQQEFSGSNREFSVQIGKNRFTNQSLCMDISDDEIDICGSLDFRDIVAFPKRFMCPGIMGPFSFFPFMQCNHGVINVTSTILGKLKINGKIVDFTGGCCYIEKDWGSSFPSAWIWMHANSFEKTNAVFMLSVANVPFLRKSFRGIVGFLYFQGKYHAIATYQGAKIVRCDIESQKVNIQLMSLGYVFDVWASYQPREGARLKAPRNGNMNREIIETLTGDVQMTMRKRNGEIIFQDASKHCGLEICASTQDFL